MGGRGVRPRLDRGALITAAGDLIDREGASALTLAALAERLGVKPPSLYNHIDSLAALERALALDGVTALTVALRGAAVGLAGREALVALATSYRAYARRHPGRYALTQRSYEQRDEELAEAGRELVAVVLAALRGYGLEGEQAVHAARALRAALHGFVSLEAGGGFGLAVDVETSFERLLALLDAGLCCERAAR